MKTKKNIKTGINAMQIAIPSPNEIKKWAERKLPDGKYRILSSNNKIIGEVTSSQTVNYKTLKPEKGGLFCERIFGPINDFECSCGNKKIQSEQYFCSKCGVEFISSKIRRESLGYIELSLPVTHIWFLRGRPSHISILLDIPKKKLEALTYCTDIILTPSKNLNTIKHINYSKYLYFLSENTSSWESSTIGQAELNWFFSYIYDKEDSLFNDSFYWRYQSLVENPSKNSTNKYLGGKGIYNFLKKLNLFFLEKEIRQQVFFLNEDLKDLEKESSILYSKKYILQTREQYNLKKFFTRQFQLLTKIKLKKIRRLKLIQQFRKNKTRPEWMILSILPVLPPDLRPIIKLENEQVAVSDLNKLYQKVLYRNKRVKRYSLRKLEFDDFLFQYAQRLLQESVDALIDNGKGGSDPICGLNDRPLKSLSDMLKGKKGRFRQNLLGKRVDYSGRSVIVVDPTLQLHQCGLPKELAIELFQPFLIKVLLKKKVRTIVGAKKFLQTENNYILKILEEIMESHPILLNRAPTLHRMSFQAFQPKLIDGRAILLHPLVCTAFNADFDGDQMAIHIPLSFEARAESWALMWSRNNLLSPATGEANILPSQDMILGCYYLTTKNLKLKNSKTNFFSTTNEAFLFHLLHNQSIHANLWIRWYEKMETLNRKEKIFEIQLSTNGSFYILYADFLVNYNNKKTPITKYIRTTFGRLVFNTIINNNFSYDSQ
jgi:DNA-directed RNA polymerase subunit beta'